MKHLAIRLALAAVVVATPTVLALGVNANEAGAAGPSPGTISTLAGNGTQGTSGNGGPATSAELNRPQDAVMDASGNLYIAEDNACIVQKVNPQGIISIFAGTGTCGAAGLGGQATSAQLNIVRGVAVDRSGNVYITSSANDMVERVAPNGIITDFAGNGTNAESGDGGPAINASLNDPWGVTVDRSGNVFISDLIGATVRKVTPDGKIATVAGTPNTGGHTGDGGPATSATLSGPQGVSVDDRGNLFVTEQNNNDVREVAANGKISTVAGNGTNGSTGNGGPATAAEIGHPSGVVADKADNLYISDLTGHVVRMVTQSTGLISTIAGTGTVGNTGNGGPATSAELASPDGLSLDLSGDLIVTDFGSSVIRQVALASPTGLGYWLIASDGGIFTHGDAGFFGSQGATPLNKPIVGMASTPDGLGYWLVASDGGIFTHGDAGFFGSQGATPLNKPIVGMASTPDGLGYWLVASDGGIFTHGDAGFFGSQGATPLNKPIVGMASTPDGLGYWLVASDGGIFTHGDAGFFGSQGATPLNKPIVGMASTPDGLGYWLVASDGGIFTHGDAGFFGSQGATPLNKPIVGMASTPDGLGYWLVASDGGIFTHGDAGFFGSQGATPLNKPIVGMAAGL